jgi:MFS family permease
MTGSRQILVLCVSFMLGIIGRYLILFLIPMLLLVDDIWWNVTDSEARKLMITGIIVAVYPVGQFFGSPILAALSEQYGRRTVLLTVQTTSMCTFLLIMWSISERSWPMLMCFTLIAGFLEGIAVLVFASFSDMFPDDSKKRLQHFAYGTASGQMGYIGGPLLGMLAQLNDLYPYLFFVALLAMTNLTAFFCLLETKRTLRKADVWETLLSFGHVFKKTNTLPYYWGNFLSYSAVNGFWRNAPFYLIDHYGLNTAQAQVQFFGGTIVGSLWAAFLVPRIPLKVNFHIIVDLLLLGSLLIGYAYARDPFPMFILIYIPLVSLVTLSPQKVASHAPVGFEAIVQGNNMALSAMADAVTSISG